MTEEEERAYCIRAWSTIRQDKQVEEALENALNVSQSVPVVPDYGYPNQYEVTLAAEVIALREEIARKDLHYHLLSEEFFASAHKPRYSTEAVDALLKEILWGTRGQGRADGLRHLAEAVRASREPKL